jgi:hypothetical protein
MEGLSSVRSRSADPSLQLACGAVLCCATMLVDVSAARGVGAEAVLVAVAFALHRGSLRSLVGILVAGATFFLPVAILGSPSAAVKGAAAMLALMAPMAGLPVHHWSAAIVRLPLPRHVRLLLEQILHQSEVLGLETRNTYRALTVRSARRGIAGVMTFSHTLPSVWLPRVALRAERVAIAMDVRGYTDHVPRPSPMVMGTARWMILAAVVAVSCAAVLASHSGTT